MKIEIVTLFPGFFESVVRESIQGRAIEKKLFDIRIINLRDYTEDKHQTADDTPYGGGGGMVLKVEPIYKCLKGQNYGESCKKGEKIILTSAAGETFHQAKAIEFSLLDRLTIICGHYLGVDERILSLFEIDEISIGDYVLTGGEAAAAVMVDAVTRLIPGVLGNFESALTDSHTEKLLGSPVYTKPEEYLGYRVPEELLSGNHAMIEKYRAEESIKKTLKNRPDILDEYELSAEGKEYLDNIKKKKRD
jgi:tRNA (guanine37-N1)-methyltransferase